MLLQYFIYFSLNLLLLLAVLRYHLLQSLRVCLLVFLGDNLFYFLALVLHLVGPALAPMIEAPDDVGFGHEFLHALRKILLPLVLPRVQDLNCFLMLRYAIPCRARTML